MSDAEKIALLRDALVTCLAELEAELENDPEAELIEAAVEKGNAALDATA